MNKLTRIEIDLTKNVFQIRGIARHSKCVFKRWMSRSKWLEVLCSSVEPGCEIGMEVCSGAHHCARILQGRGFVVKLIAPQCVKQYVKSNKILRGLPKPFARPWADPT